jgi:hypothetical protein
MKTCSSCGEAKDKSCFNKRTASRDGLNASCVECRKTRRKTYQSEKDYRKKYYKENKEENLQRVSQWYRDNPGKKVEHRKTHRKNNLLKVRRAEAEKNSRRRSQTPSWLTKEQKKKIMSFYELRDDVRLTTGEEYHVDHIVPLKGKNVCGLHVPWNLQVLPSDVNLSKWNNTGEGQMNG